MFFAFKKRRSAPDMFKNYFRIAFRTFRHQKLYSIINVVGLAFRALGAYQREVLSWQQLLPVPAADGLRVAELAGCAQRSA